MKGKLLLTPTPLGGPSDPLLTFYQNSDIFNSVDYFLFESPTKGYKIMSQLSPGLEISPDNVFTLDKNSKGLDLKNYIGFARDHVVAVMPDAGMPAISDPGRKLVREAHRKNIVVEPAIATSSIVAALASSGLNGEQFVYHGYLPRNKEKRIMILQKIEASSKKSGATQIFIETPYRNIHVWKDLMNFMDEFTDLSVSIDLFTDKSIIKTAHISDWKRMKWPKLDDRQAVFMINAKRQD